MRDFIIFVIFVVAVFFGIGEWQGWFLGIPGQTPVYVYKRDFVANATRRTINREELPLSVSGKVRRGTVTVRATFRKPDSFQAGTRGSEEKEVFEQEFRAGQIINLSELIDEGVGVYRVQLIFNDATGLFKVKLPSASEL